jgi:Adaptin N terminal region
MSAVRIILRYMDEITNQDTLRLFSKKLTPPLVTLLNSEPEIQYVALRSINLIVQKRPKILEHEIKVFFCKYNDPIYVKMEKLEIVIRLASINNTDQVSSNVSVCVYLWVWVFIWVGARVSECETECRSTVSYLFYPFSRDFILFHFLSPCPTASFCLPPTPSRALSLHISIPYSISPSLSQPCPLLQSTGSS